MREPLVDAVDFQVIGERKDDPGHLLLMGDDGQWYDYDVAHGEIALIDCPNDAWAMDVTDKVALRIEVPKNILAS
jgi:hypothetical protein